MSYKRTHRSNDLKTFVYGCIFDEATILNVFILSDSIVTGFQKPDLIGSLVNIIRLTALDSMLLAYFKHYTVFLGLNPPQQIVINVKTFNNI